MGIPYFPGCTLALRAKEFDASGRAVAAELGFPLEELPDWQCCGATFPLASDNSLALIAPTRVLVQAEQTGSDRVTTLCAICYNVLKRTEVALRRHPEQLDRINWFISTDATTEGQTYTGAVRVVHLLELLRDDLGWENLKRKVSRPLAGARIAPYYGCLLLRPQSEIGLDNPDAPTILSDLITAMGGVPAEFPFQSECCGSYLAVNRPEVPSALSRNILDSARKHGAQAVVTVCPLCRYNLQTSSSPVSRSEMPVLYFTELLATALGLDAPAGEAVAVAGGLEEALPSTGGL